MNSVADAATVEIMNDNNLRLASVDMKDSAAAIRAIANCVNEHPPSEHPPGSRPPPEAETMLSGTGFFVAPNHIVTNSHVVRGCTKAIQVRYPERASSTATISGQDAINDLVLLHTNMATFRQPPSTLGHELATKWPPMAFPALTFCPPAVTVRWEMLRP